MSTTIFVCVSCKSQETDAEGLGNRMHRALTERVSELPDARNVLVTPVECLGVCKRPCTVALAGKDKWTYVIGDLDPMNHVEDVLTTALQYHLTADGIIPWRQRLHAIRKGVVSRVPPLGYHAVPTDPDTKL